MDGGREGAMKGGSVLNSARNCVKGLMRLRRASWPERGCPKKKRFSSATAAQPLDVSSGLWLNPAPTS